MLLHVNDPQPPPVDPSMKNLILIVSLAAFSLGFSSCCSMFGYTNQYQGYRTETRQVKTCQYDIVTEKVASPGDSKSGKSGMVETIEKKVPRYKTVTKRVPVSHGPCTRYYCPEKEPCGTTAESTLKMASPQGSSGSPNIGLIPTMKPIAP
jgi:hypothetical protein